MYNYARLFSLCALYAEKVSVGIYPPLPQLDEIDFGLLTQQVCFILFSLCLLMFLVCFVYPIEISLIVGGMDPFLQLCVVLAISTKEVNCGLGVRSS